MIPGINGADIDKELHTPVHMGSGIDEGCPLCDRIICESDDKIEMGGYEVHKECCR